MSEVVPEDGPDLSVGVVLPRDLPAEQLVGFGRRVEALGFDELWVVEDAGFRGGVAQAATVLASTTTLRVGLGILPAAARNAAFAAMEVATLAELFPGRVDVGIGHGMPAWMSQVGASTSSPLGLLEEHLAAVRTILHGKKADVAGDHVSLDGFALELPPTHVPRVLAGVRGPRSLAVAGRVADGTVLAEPVTPEYLRAARAAIGATGPHRLVAYNLAVVDHDADAARDAVRPALAVVGEPDWAPHVDPLPFASDLRALRDRSPDAEAFAAGLPAAWVDQLAVVGTPDQARARIADLHDAGASSVVLVPVGDDADLAVAKLAEAL
ncbi:LLM class flavin-dependent oxidoreductase [Solicola sp. PLA-1-18]|uniref:LLM class flavin-dependent oxidoreductase n=1 Tax=Solicola sp. PLA-1-18 TaxID=3380532 RepID=UPI003B7CA960